MIVSVLSAAKCLCELRDWTVSNLELQKLVYLAQMLHLGRTGIPLVREAFEAWDYGPVVPELYHHVKGFGDDPVKNVFHWVKPVKEASPEYAALKEIVDSTRGMTAGQLVSATHREGGAWARNYRSGVRGIRIPNGDILKEYRDRTRTTFPS